MIPNINQSIDEIIKNASPAAKVIWQQIRLATGENASVRQYYVGMALPGSEFTVAGNPRRVYLANYLILNHNNAVPSNTDFFFTVTGLFGATHLKNVSLGWDTTAAVMKWLPNTIILKDIEFTAITSGVGGVTPTILFNGYKITY